MVVFFFVWNVFMPAKLAKICETIPFKRVVKWVPVVQFGISC
jgi:hypothetical protein